MQRPQLPLALAALFFAASSCGGSPEELTDAGYRALGAGDPAAAAARFEDALEAIDDDTAHPAFLRAKMGSIEARAKTAPEAAAEEFLELARTLPARIDDRSFSQVGSRLGDSGHLGEAIRVLDVGRKRYPESPHLAALIQRLGDRAKRDDDPASLERLRGMGYVGD